MPTQGPAIVWFRQDLRLADNPALRAAAGEGRPLVLLYVLEDEDAGERRPGGASRWWLHQALQDLGRAMEGGGGRLVLRRGPARAALSGLVRETGATSVY